MLTCNVAKDLLPSYVDELVSEETAEEIAAHLADCTDCKTIYEQIKAPLASAITQDEKEIDYLKKIKTKSRMRGVKYSVISVAVVVIILVSSMYAISIGKPVGNADLNYVVSITEAKTVRVELSPNNGVAFSVRTKVTYNETTGQMTEFIISPRQVPEWFPNGNGTYFGYEYTPDDGLSENFQIVIELSDETIIVTADDLEN